MKGLPMTGDPESVAIQLSHVVTMAVTDAEKFAIRAAERPETAAATSTADEHIYLFRSDDPDDTRQLERALDETLSSHVKKVEDDCVDRGELPVGVLLLLWRSKGEE